ncbi:MAG: hypothetical protein M1814_003791 [Vezdaea aestivalis]|nr:MAG: hypothetical protein M1814_003791 [Vezdaea aestivalis]
MQAIEGVIIFFMNKGLGAPGTWVSYVDAAIVEGIQRGGAIALGFSDAQGGNPGSVKWADFMRRMKNNQLGERDAHDYAWSDSEQTSTEYGRRTADSLSLPTTNQTLRWYKFTQIFRWVMRNRQLVVQLIKDAAPFPTGFIISKSAQLIIDWLTNITDATPTICGSDAAWELSELDGVPLSNTGIIQNTGILIKMAFKFAVCIGLN